MDASPPQRTVPFNLDLVFRGMGRRLLLYILCLVVPPMALIGWISYQAAYGRLEQDIQKTVRLNVELKRQQIDAYLQNHLSDAEREGSRPATIAFYNALVRRQQKTEETPSAFVLSPPWHAAVSAYGSDIRLHADLHGYHDILLIDRDGNVIYSSANAGDLDGNLNPAGADAAGIGTAFRESLATGRPVFSGFESGVHEDTGVRAYITAAIGNAGEPPVGVIALKILGDDIQRILNMPPEPGENVRIYLIDAEQTLLAGTVATQRRDTRLTINTAIARQWAAAIASDRPPMPPPGLMEYQAPDGHWITGTYAPIHPGGRSYALVVEVDRTMTFSDIYHQQRLFLVILILTGLGIIAASVALARMLVDPVLDLTEQVSVAVQGQPGPVAAVSASHELGRLARACKDLINHTRALTIEHETQSRFVAGTASLHRLLGGAQASDEICLKSLEFLCDFLDLNEADFYICTDDGELQCACHFPGQPTCGDGNLLLSPGEGCVGEAVFEKTLLAYRKDAMDDLVIPVPTVDLGNLAAVPLMLQETVIGGLEAKKTNTFSLFEGHFLQAAAEFIAIALEAALIREKELALLAMTREQAEKLKHREAALEAKTRELETQSQAFQDSEQVLQLKHLELEAANAQMAKNAADLEANMAILEQQKRDMLKQNAELEQAHRELADKARQLEISSQYKTEFMANMSHELRTPLNSILLLSRLLLENKQNTLSTKQAEFAQTIYSAGEDLLNLINEILDLAKVESGKIAVESAPVRLQAIAGAMQASFTPLAEQSGIHFSVHMTGDVPEKLISDQKRIEQIVKNFLSNAFKFTPSGEIRLTFSTRSRPRDDHENGTDGHVDWLSISVSDTGIGIPKAKQEMVFDAFQQVDGSTRRKYGGTGLGLSISRELARMLGGEITLDSEEGQGSCFALHLPLQTSAAEEPGIIRSTDPTTTPAPTPSSPPLPEDIAAPHAHEYVPDDRHRLNPGNPCILIMDQDVAAGETIVAMAHDHGYKAVVAEQRMTGLHFADYFLPTAAFINPHLGVPDGWPVIDQIKSTPHNRNIPVFTFSNATEHVRAALHGAAGHIRLPFAKSRLASAFQRIGQWRSRADRAVLVAASDPQQAAMRIADAIGIDGIRYLPASSPHAVREALAAGTVDAAIVRPDLKKGMQQQFLTLWQERPIPLLLYAGGDAGNQGRTGDEPLRRLLDLKRIESPDRLLMALLACLHLPTDSLDARLRRRTDPLSNHIASLKGRKVLLIDDDMRTVFAVTSVLEEQGVEVFTGKTGKESLDKLDSFPDIDLILMDVMITDVDGYRAIRKIRDRQGYENIPILALTAKAMQGDRAKCIDAGADDYLSKPVNLDKLTSMLKIWLDPALNKQRIDG